ncbi:MAG: S-methyl-5-thioribose-1-phosphate isomerase [Anaerovoracaceae bacterium]
MTKDKIEKLDFDTVALSDDGRALVIIDQTLLPGEMKFIRLSEQRDIREAIYRLQVRGAPAIGVAAAIGIYLAALEISENVSEEDTFFEKLSEAKIYLQEARPTAVNLRWALDRMYDFALSKKGLGPEVIAAQMKGEALAIRDEDIEVCRKIGEHGLRLLKRGQGILTHCNAGHLACVRYGTATAPIYLGCERGYDFRVFADETRPMLQGARLTSFELARAGIDVTLICDNMASSVMKKGWIDAVITGCDRVAANGDAANKIGTSGAAILAKYYGIPFYIAAPTSTIDFGTATGADIVIEERSGDEIKKMWYSEPMAVDEVKTFNPSFDVTEASLITGIITEYGVLYPPYDVSLAELKEKIGRKEK